MPEFVRGLDRHDSFAIGSVQQPAADTRSPTSFRGAVRRALAMRAGAEGVAAGLAATTAHDVRGGGAHPPESPAP